MLQISGLVICITVVLAQLAFFQLWFKLSNTVLPNLVML